MPKPITINVDGICARCGRDFKAGSLVTYSTKPGSVDRYHYPNCMSYVYDNKAAIAAPAAFADKLTSALNPVGVVLPAQQAHSEPKQLMLATTSTSTSKPKIPLNKLTTRSKWYEILPHVMLAGMTRALLIGPPGTGKSHIASMGYDLRVTCHEDAGPESMLGTFIQKDGETIWIDGPATVAMRTGSRLIMDEIDHNSSETTSLCYAFLDDRPQIMLPTGEIVKAAPGYQVICTSNANPSDLPEAILDRLEAILVADVPHEDAIEVAVASLMEKDATKAKRAKAVMLNYYKNSVKQNWKWKGEPTMRRTRNWCKLVAYGMSDDLAGTIVFGTSGAEILSAMMTASLCISSGEYTFTEPMGNVVSFPKNVN